MRKALALLLVIFFISGCVPKGYQKRDYSGYGYQDTKIQEDIYRVDFLGHEGTDPSTLKDYTLLRCAELSLQNGYKYFTILETQADTQVTVVPIPVAYHDPFDYHYRYPYPHRYHRRRYDTELITYVEPSLSNTIQCFTHLPEDVYTLVYDAEKIQLNIKNKYNIE